MANADFDKIGVIGMGIIGKGIANHLRQNGKDVYVWNRSPKPEPNFLGSPGEMAQLVKVIQIYVTDGDALLSIMGQLKGSLTSHHIILNHSTVEPHASVAAHEIAQSVGADFLDAPFTGSKEAAKAGALVYYIGGDPGVLEQVKPVLELSAKEIIYIGKVGEASVIKIATNMISAATVEVLSEAYGLTKAAGIDPQVLQHAIENNACNSVLASMKLPTMIEGNFEPHFSLKNMFKDSKFALELGKQFAVDMPVLTTTANIMFRTMQKGRGDDDYSVLAANYQSDKHLPDSRS
ncbi:MAG: NAD(P)-dependent oxidoreductase [Verrucomicrobiales bacterium]|nr:NAD(P)-dependent oxidoreductase [Verrucomicrobiales bacterium]